MQFEHPEQLKSEDGGAVDLDLIKCLSEVNKVDGDIPAPGATRIAPQQKWGQDPDIEPDSLTFSSPYTNSTNSFRNSQLSASEKPTLTGATERKAGPEYTAAEFMKNVWKPEADADDFNDFKDGDLSKVIPDTKVEPMLKVDDLKTFSNTNSEKTVMTLKSTDGYTEITNMPLSRPGSDRPIIAPSPDGGSVPRSERPIQNSKVTQGIGESPDNGVVPKFQPTFQFPKLFVPDSTNTQYPLGQLPLIKFDPRLTDASQRPR